MENDILIEAQQVVPQGEAAAMSVQFRRNDHLYLVGPDSARLGRYIRTLAGVETPQQGELLLFGRTLESLDKRQWREQRQIIGYVARNAPILSILRGVDNVMLPALYHKRMSRSEARERALALIAEIGCEGDVDRLPAHLNRQQRLQLAIARATILDPQLLFMEEPFVGLSVAEQLPIHRYLLHWAESHTLAVATQNLHLVKDSATQLLYIGRQQVFHFADWQGFVDSEEEEVKEYLHLYHEHFQIT